MPPTTSTPVAPTTLSSLKPVKSFSGKTAGWGGPKTATKKVTPKVKVVTKIVKVNALTTAQRNQLRSTMRVLAKINGYTLVKKSAKSAA